MKTNRQSTVGSLFDGQYVTTDSGNVDPDKLNNDRIRVRVMARF